MGKVLAVALSSIPGTHIQLSLLPHKSHGICCPINHKIHGLIMSKIKIKNKKLFSQVAVAKETCSGVRLGTSVNSKEKQGVEESMEGAS